MDAPTLQAVGTAAGRIGGHAKAKSARLPLLVDGQPKTTNLKLVHQLKHDGSRGATVLTTDVSLKVTPEKPNLCKSSVPRVQWVSAVHWASNVFAHGRSM